MAFAGRHPYLSLALAGLTLALIYTEIAGRLSGVRRIGPATLTALINRNTLADRTVRYRENWRYDEKSKSWWLDGGLPDLWQGE